MFKTFSPNEHLNQIQDYPSLPPAYVLSPPPSQTSPHTPLNTRSQSTTSPSPKVALFSRKPHLPMKMQQNDRGKEEQTLES